MSVNGINARQGIILHSMEYGEWYALSDLPQPLKESASPATLRRDLESLRHKKYLLSQGERKGTKYTPTISGLLYTPYDPKAYFDQPIDRRGGKTSYFLTFFDQVPTSFFSKEEVQKMDKATKHYRSKLKVSDTLARKELERFVIELSWKSSRIEGNTYTLLDTERLLKEGKEATGHPKEEAIMILNHKKAFQFVLEGKEHWLHPKMRELEDLHRLLISDMDVSFGLRKMIVGILGSSYLPLSVHSQIKEELESLLQAVERAKDVYTKAFLMLVGISYIQGFEDGNKRTARLSANAILVAHNCAPLSYRSVEEDEFKRSMLVFYEKQSIIPMIKIFQEQYLFSCENYLIADPS